MPASGFGQKAFHNPESDVVCSDILQDFGTKQVDQNPHDISMIWPRTAPEEIFGKLWETLEKRRKQRFPKFPKHSHVRSEPRCPPRRLCNPGTIGEVRSEIGFSRARIAAWLRMANNAIHLVLAQCWLLNTTPPTCLHLGVPVQPSGAYEGPSRSMWKPNKNMQNHAATPNLKDPPLMGPYVFPGTWREQCKQQSPGRSPGAPGRSARHCPSSHQMFSSGIA